MNNLRLTVFDIFSYMIPGLCYIILFNWAIEGDSVSLIAKAFTQLSIYSIAAYSFISYLIGFISDAIAGVLILRLTDLIRGNLRNRIVLDLKKENTEFNEEEYHFATIYSFVDVNAPHIREKADQFSAMSGLARNLSLAFIAFGLVLIWNIIWNTNVVGWIATLIKIIISFTISVILMLRADTFRRWGHIHLLNAYVFLKREGLNQKHGTVCPPGSC